MFCDKCGTEIAAGGKFCPKCGSPVQNAQTMQGAAQTVQTVNNASQAASGIMNPGGVTPSAQLSGAGSAPANSDGGAKKKSHKGLIFGIIAVIIVAAVFFGFPHVKNFYYNKMASPKKLLAYSLEKSVDEGASSAATIYKKFFKVFNPIKMGGDLSATVELGKDGEDMIGLVGDLLDVDLSGIKKAGITASFDTNKEKTEIEAKTTLNKDGIISADVIMDNEEGYVYLQIPELSSQYLKFEVPSGSASLTGMFGVSAPGSSYLFSGDNYELIEEILNALPKDSEVKTIIKRYGYILAEGIKDVKKEKGKKLEVEGVSQDCTLLEVTIDADALEDIEKKMSDALEEDEDVKKIAERIASIDDLKELKLDEDTAVKAIQSLISGIMEKLKKMAENREDGELAFSLYVDDKCNIIGLETEYVQSQKNWWTEETTTTTIPLVIEKAENGGEVGYLILAGEKIEITGTGKKSGDKVTADFLIKAGESELATVSTKNFNVEKLKSGQLAGVFTIAPGNSLFSAFPLFGSGSSLNGLNLKNVNLQLDVNADMAKSSCKATLLYKDDEYLTVTFSSKLGAPAGISIPKKSTAIEDDDDLESFTKTVNWDKYLKKLKKTALPGEVTDYLEDLFDLIKDGDFDELSLPFGGKSMDLGSSTYDYGY